jgi:hypothetical protein
MYFVYKPDGRVAYAIEHVGGHAHTMVGWGGEGRGRKKDRRKVDDVGC